MSSANGKGRTLFEMLTGRNKRDMTAQELQVHNPLQAKVGWSVSVNYDPDLSGYRFYIESIWVWETRIGEQTFHHTDYNLKAAAAVGQDGPVRLKLRLIPDEESPHDLGHRFQVLRPYMDFGWKFAEENNFLDVLADEEGVFKILADRDGNPIDEDQQPTYWRVDDVRDPYRCRVTILEDADGDGSVQKDELKHADYLVWDYHRDTTDETTRQAYREFLNVEEEVEYDDGDAQCVWFTIYTGREVEPFQVSVI
ncbi:hypothetical protein OJF2_35840 [Aquisphaera giovannonii]|uniref:EF-hand domain-containing protein n=1 Tax=Aquisphaera giovannonii TaxID=406548 RepID=A0A5B9W4B3_9BACT|nr:hypothetical protein [Aquisphaera giovannonii]QEH35039.1 hypothetical protein OJF2_35840 [Aquisphaera giovannonii]